MGPVQKGYVFMKLTRILISIFMIFCLSAAIAAPQKELSPRWIAFNPLSTKTIDYQPWQQFLNKYVSTNDEGVNLVNYAGVTAAEKAQLSKFIKKLEAINIDNYNRNVQMAFWINLYNIATVDLILKHYPVASIMDISPNISLFTRGPWEMKLVKVKGVALSLNDIEHRILRPIWHDPRIHFAVNCASYGCPNLQKQVFVGKNIDLMLNAATREYINDPRGVIVADGTLTVSKIFIWYMSDFGGTDAGVIAFIKLYADPKLLAKLKDITTISNSEYDWALNSLHKENGTKQ